MREIKFRVWDKKHEWFLEDEMFIELDGTLYDDAFHKYDTPNREIESVKPNGYVVEQYTGINDKNGKPIFEGDIIFHLRSQTKATVKWSQEYASFEAQPTEETWITKSYWKKCEVIGNIHEVTHD